MGEYQNPILSIRTDSNSSAGYGHIMRCLAVSEELTKLGVSVRFFLSPESDREPVERKNYNSIILKNIGLATDELLELLNPNDGPLLFDSYDVSEQDLEIFHRNGFRVILFDDAMRLKKYPCDLVVDSAPNAQFLPYKGFPETRFCLGSTYFPLREEFLNVRRKKFVAEQVNTVMISFGGSDHDDVTSKTLKAMVGIEGKLQFIVALGPAYMGQACEFAKIDERIKIVQNVHDMAELMVTADVAVCSSGGTAREFAYLGIPMVLLSLSPDQVPIARAMTQAAEYLNDKKKAIDDTDIARAVVELMADKPKRQLMHIAGLTLIDGRGSKRVASAIYSVIKG